MQRIARKMGTIRDYLLPKRIKMKYERYFWIITTVVEWFSIEFKYRIQVCILSAKRDCQIFLFE